MLVWRRRIRQSSWPQQRAQYGITLIRRLAGKSLAINGLLAKDVASCTLSNQACGGATC
jgi:hypothetical protein